MTEQELQELEDLRLEYEKYKAAVGGPPAIWRYVEKLEQHLRDCINELSSEDFIDTLLHKLNGTKPTSGPEK